MLSPYVFAKSMFDEVFDSAFSGHNASAMMRTDIRENNTGYELIIDMPGVKKENVSAELKEGHLIISATIGNHSEDSSSEGKYLRRERFVGSFRRSFYVGDKLTQEDIKGKFENDGTLHLFIPKETAPAQIEQKKLITIEG